MALVVTDDGRVFEIQIAGQVLGKYVLIAEKVNGVATRKELFAGDETGVEELVRHVFPPGPVEINYKGRHPVLKSQPLFEVLGSLQHVHHEEETLGEASKTIKWLILPIDVVGDV